MRRLILYIFLTIAATAVCGAVSYTNETLTYKVMYKWGIINKKAGDVTINIRASGNNYITRLTASSAPWADKVFKVRDTLNGVMTKSPMLPVFYEKVSHEGSEDKHDTVRFTRNGSKVTGACTRVKYKKGELKNNEKRELTAVGTTLDMLSSFYYMRAVKFEDWHPGQVLTVNLFSGKRKELLTFKYQGIETVDIDGKKHRCHHVTFIFTGDDGKTSSDNMDAWLTADAARIPVKLEGQLPVGKVQCIYTGKYPPSSETGCVTPD